MAHRTSCYAQRGTFIDRRWHFSRPPVLHGKPQEPSRPRLDTNQAYVEELARPATLAIDDPMAVFAFVLAKACPTG